MEPDPAFEPVDSLADVLAVLDGEAGVRTQEVLHGLTERKPDHCRGWTFGDLKSALEPYDATPCKSAGVMVVARYRILDALDERAVEDLQDEEE